MHCPNITKWPLCVTDGMEKQLYSGIVYDFYKNRPDNLYTTLVNTANTYPDKTGLMEQDKSITYKKFKESVDIFASNLYSVYNIRKGDRVALLMVNSIDFCISFYAIVKLGAVAVTLSTKSKSLELIHPLKDSGARILILNGQWWENIRDIVASTEIKNCIISKSHGEDIVGQPIENLYIKNEVVIPDNALSVETDPAVIMYTSGTTGTPKGALLTHFNLIHSIISYKRVFNLNSDDSTIIAVPIFHITGLSALLGLFVYIGGTIYLQPYFDSKKVLETVRDKGITFFHASPTIFIMLLGESKNFGEIKSWKKAACGSANMPSEVLGKIKKWLPGMDFRTVYGLTETSSPATIFPTDVIGSGKIGSSGIQIPGVYIKIVDDAGEELPPGFPGELLIKGSVVLQKYWNNAKATSSSIRDGWFKTGDMARIDIDGFVYIVDRKKDMINRGGEKIYSLEVENVLYNHPAVREVAVIGTQDPVYGEVVKAVIVLNKGYELGEEEVKKYVGERLAKYKVPHYVQFIDDMPRTDNGKISKKLIKSIYL